MISPDECKDRCADYTVMIVAQHRETRITLAEELRKREIPFEIYKRHIRNHIPERFIHIYSKDGEILYSANNQNLLVAVDQLRIDNTIAMYQEMFRVYERDFRNREVDVRISIDDSPWEPFEYEEEYGWGHVFAYSTTYTLKDRVIPIPDYKSCFREDCYYYKDATPELCREAAEKPWTDPRAYWIGSFLNESRLNLWEMSRKYPEHILAEAAVWVGYKPMPEQARYKYLIDVRGYGWTDRVKTLLMLGRPVLLVDRPVVEWYMEYMEPMKHYVPVKEDLSDLIEKIQYLNSHPDQYDFIVKNTKKFVRQYLSTESILKYLRDVTLQYGTQELKQ